MAALLPLEGEGVLRSLATLDGVVCWRRLPEAFGPPERSPYTLTPGLSLQVCSKSAKYRE